MGVGGGGGGGGVNPTLWAFTMGPNEDTVPPGVGVRGAR